MSQKKGLRIRLEEFISSERGQRFFNFAYSIGAAVVIWGALFKILHLPGGDTLLTIGMGTEVIMFFLTAFDRPPVSYTPTPTAVSTVPSASNTTSGVPTPVTAAAEAITTGVSTNGIVGLSDLGITDETKGVMAEMAKLRETTSALNSLYESQLRNLSSQLSAIESSNRDAVEMKDILNRSAAESRRYCDETMKMAENMAQLNAIYERMITAMSSGNAFTGNKL